MRCSHISTAEEIKLNILKYLRHIHQKIEWIQKKECRSQLCGSRSTVFIAFFHFTFGYVVGTEGSADVTWEPLEAFQDERTNCKACIKGIIRSAVHLLIGNGTFFKTTLETVSVLCHTTDIKNWIELKNFVKFLKWISQLRFLHIEARRHNFEWISFL